MTGLPLSWVYGYVCFGAGRDDAWALFVAPTHPYSSVDEAAKHRALARLTAAVEAAEADLQILRVAREFDVERYRAQASEHGAAHAEAHRRLVDEHAARLEGVRAAPLVTLAVRLAEPDRDVVSRMSRAAERGPRGWVEAARQAVGWNDRRLLAAAELERLRVAADDVHARLA